MPFLDSIGFSGNNSSSLGGPSFQLFSSNSSIEEGMMVSVYIIATDAEVGSIVPYTITGISQEDLSYGNLTGTFTIDEQGFGQIALVTAKDGATEGVEVLTLTLDNAPDVSISISIQDTSVGSSGEVLYEIPGTYNWVCPPGVTSVSVVAIGGGGMGAYFYNDAASCTGGGGGGLGYVNNFSVIPGVGYTVVVGRGSTTSTTSYTSTGITSYFNSSAICAGQGGLGGSWVYSGSVSGGQGGYGIGHGVGKGGNGGTIQNGVDYYFGGGGGAGGYENWSGSTTIQSGVVGAGGGAGGSYIVGNTTYRNGSAGVYSGAGGGVGYGSTLGIRGGSGGGTGVYGRHTYSGAALNFSTTGGSYTGTIGYDGQAFSGEAWTSNRDGTGLQYVANSTRYGGGGPGGNNIYSGAPISNYRRSSSGAVRIMWGPNRTFPDNAWYVPPPNVTVSLTQTINNPDSITSGDYFGYSVSIDGNYAAISAPRDSNGNMASDGTVYIYNTITGDWTDIQLVHTIENQSLTTLPYPTGDNNAEMGISISLSGRYIAMGAPWSDVGSGGTIIQTGKVYIYDIIDQTLKHTFIYDSTLSSYNQYYGFGWKVSMSGAYVAATCHGGGYDGSRYNIVVLYNAITGEFIREIQTPGTSTIQNLTVPKIFGNYLIVGESHYNGTESGRVLCYDITDGSLVYTINNPNQDTTDSGDYFGRAIAVGGNGYLVASAPYEDQSGEQASGRVYVFDITDGSLLRTIVNPNNFGTRVSDTFGWKVSISDNLLMVTSYAEDSSAGNNVGILYVFDITTGILLQTIDSPIQVANQFFGDELDSSGRAVLVASYLMDDPATDAGKAFLYTIGGV